MKPRKQPKPAHPTPPIEPTPTIGSAARIIVRSGQPLPKFLERMIVKTRKGGTTL